jgi:hypothetical protein
MSCPYFFPVSLAIDVGSLPARVPLGQLYEGTCHADPAGSAAPEPAMVKNYCNFGYGITSCSHFPEGAEADAVRFSLSAARELVWILEKDFAPVRFGRLEEANAIVTRQAEVFLENHDGYIGRTSGSRIDI